MACPRPAWPRFRGSFDPFHFRATRGDPASGPRCFVRFAARPEDPRADEPFPSWTRRRSPVRDPGSSPWSPRDPERNLPPAGRDGGAEGSQSASVDTIRRGLPDSGVFPVQGTEASPLDVGNSQEGEAIGRPEGSGAQPRGRRAYDVQAASFMEMGSGTGQSFRTQRTWISAVFCQCEQEPSSPTQPGRGLFGWTTHPVAGHTLFSVVWERMPSSPNSCASSVWEGRLGSNRDARKAVPARMAIGPRNAIGSTRESSRLDGNAEYPGEDSSIIAKSIRARKEIDG